MDRGTIIISDPDIKFRIFQVISCDGDRYVLIWALRKAPTDDGVDSDFGDDIKSKSTSGSVGWSKLKLQSALPASLVSAGKYSPAIGKYEQLNKVILKLIGGSTCYNLSLFFENELGAT